MMVLVMMKDGVDNALMMMTMRLGARELGVSDDLIACCFEFEDYCVLKIILMTMMMIVMMTMTMMMMVMVMMTMTMMMTTLQ